jgi:2-oxoglutarate decarboxylase
MPDASRTPDALGPNAWLVDEMFEEFRRDPSSVADSWREFFEGYLPGGANLARPSVPGPGSVRPEGDGGGVGSAAPGSVTAGSVAAGPRGGSSRQPTGATLSSANGGAMSGGPASLTHGGTAENGAVSNGTVAATPTGPPSGGVVGSAADGPVPVPLRGAAARIVANMTASLGVPTATSFRVVPAKVLEVNRLVLNNQLVRNGTAGKVSFTHLIAFAVVRAATEVPAINSSFVETAATQAGAAPAVLHHRHVNLGLAVDQTRPDGSHALLVPVIRNADSLDFRGFWQAYEELIRKIRNNKMDPADFAGATMTLTNPGTLGTVQSVPRLMPGQGAIVGVGSIDYPAECRHHYVHL